MKRIDIYISEKLHINNTTKIEYMYHPKDKDELIKCITNKIDKEGYEFFKEDLDLNDIDVSQITDMSNLFDIMGSNNRKLVSLSQKGNFNISDWDVSNVTDMSCMFYCSGFNGDISKWDVSNVENMGWMFTGSYFDGDISKWDVSGVENMQMMFNGSKFTSKNGNISDWNISNVKNMQNIFTECPLKNNPPKWYKV